MKISYNWLKEYVDVKNSARMAAEWLTMSGLEVTSVEESQKDSILEIEITTNRPDWLSVVGVARELAAVAGKRLMLPKVPAVLPVGDRIKQVKVEIHDRFLCPRYSARIINVGSVGPSPKWLKGHLEAIGVRCVNNVVDVTNFCLFELGHPMHAFDYDKLAGGTVIIRRSKKGEKIVTIDGVERELEGDMLVIADEKRPVAIAGIMGGRETEVNEKTRTVLLESACFDPVSVRKTQRRLGLSTDSGYRFEREVDLEGVVFASNRAAKLIVEVCGGKMGILKDAGVKVAKTNVIKLSIDKVNDILDLNLTAVEVKKILVSLGLKVGGALEELRVEAPSFRKDLKRQEDLIEEVARIYGYDKIPTTIPKIIGHVDRIGFRRRVEGLAKDILIAQGLDEAVTYSLVDRNDVKNARLFDESKGAFIKNPLSSQQEMMRPSLIPGILNAARFNINRKIEDLGIFELSNVYFRTNGNGYREEANLCVLLQRSGADLFDIKGIVEVLFDGLGIKDYDFANGGTDIFYPQAGARIIVGANEVGVIGAVKREILDAFDIKKEVFLCEIMFEKLCGSVNIEKRFTPLAKFLPTRRDISLVAAKEVSVKDLIGAIKEAGGSILKGAVLFDEYFGQQIPNGKRGLTFSLEYLCGDRQLTEEEIEKAHSAVREALVNRFGAVIR